MATSQKSAFDRLTKLWTQWGMGQSLASDDANAQKLALAGLTQALTGSGPSLAVRSVQALLVDPELPGANARPLFEPLWQAVREHWGLAGTGNHADVMRLQALLLAAWDEQSATATHELYPALVSPWKLLRGRDLQRPMLAVWLASCQRDELADWANKAQHGSRKAPLEAYRDLIDKQIFTEDADEQISIAPHVRELTKVVHQLLSGLDADNAALQASHHSQELLWWGQALYCYSQRRSFRRIADPDEAIWWAAVEAADRSVTLPVEPAASYLQEVLRTAGVAIDEQRTVWEHARSLSLVLKKIERATLPNEFAGLVREDAFGLPVSLLGVDPGVDEDVLRDSLGVEADVTLDRGEWAAWVFRELVLQRRWPAQEPTP